MSKINLGKVGGFVAHYGAELANVVGALRVVAGALPLQADDRASIDDKLEQLAKGAAAAARGAEAVAGEVRTVVKKSDVDAAVAAYLSSPAGVAAIAAAVKANAKN